MTTATLHNTEIFPGYFTTERIGSGGYGEVWRAEAPGGFEKAIKIVYGFHDDERATRELKALDRIKRVRHPFVLSVERADIYDGRLAILTELADMSLDQRFEECRNQELPGIPRNELLGYMRDAADALDYLLREHVLQHLDIKPENLLLVAGHVKVADFGLIKRVSERTEHSMVGGMTPTYAAPEIFDGRPTPFSDQYSLAIVYQEMLTGTLPFPGRTSAQLALQHTQGKPMLSALPPGDLEVIARALSKRPTDRYASCLEFVEALTGSRASPTRDRRTEQRSDSQSIDDGIDTESLSSGATECIAPAGESRPKSRPVVHENLCTEAIDGASDSKPIAVRRPSAPAVASIRVSKEVVDAPVPPTDNATAAVRPTLYVGIGGVGARVLGRLRGKLPDDDAWSAACPMLLLDTDRSTIQAATSGLLGGQFYASEMCHLPLRKSQQYRTESPKLLNWLSRRWLYNIPRSLQTRGFRPLGRLAMVDHALRLQEALRKALERLSEPTPDENPGEALPLRDDEPRVVLVSSTDGGTGAGMVVDVAFAIRSLASKLELDRLEVSGLLLHGTGRQHEQTELSLANTYSLLSELATIHRVGYHGSHTPDAWTAPFEGNELPFDQLYFVHLGDELGEPQFADAITRMADYLYLEAASPLGATLEQCRMGVQPADESKSDVRLRSLSLVVAHAGEVFPEPLHNSAAVREGTSAVRVDGVHAAPVHRAIEVRDENVQGTSAAGASVCVTSVMPAVAVVEETSHPEDTEPAVRWAIEEALEHAVIHPSGCGHVRRRILLAPRDESAEEIADIVERIAPAVAVLPAGVNVPTIVCEAEDLSLVQLAEKLVESRPDVAEAASRLHTRNDIEWQPLAKLVEEA